jgi:hypothetical protein
MSAPIDELTPVCGYCADGAANRPQFMPLPKAQTPVFHTTNEDEAKTWARNRSGYDRLGLVAHPVDIYPVSVNVAGQDTSHFVAYRD